MWQGQGKRVNSRRVQKLMPNSRFGWTRKHAKQAIRKRSGDCLVPGEAVALLLFGSLDAVRHSTTAVRCEDHRK